MTTLPFSQACENNKAPILAVLKRVLKDSHQVLEIGSGTGQHAVYFSAHLPHLMWQPSDQQAYLDGLKLRVEAEPQKNLFTPLELDVLNPMWPKGFDAVFSANTAHIMPWSTAQHMLQRVANSLAKTGIFALYGPFNYEGKYTSESNARFDEWLKQGAAHQGIRHFEDIQAQLENCGMRLLEDNALPANNRLLVFQKHQ